MFDTWTWWNLWVATSNRLVHLWPRLGILAAYELCPGGFMRAFFKACWDTIKKDVMAVIHQFSSLHCSNLYWLIFANIDLLPKNKGAEEVTDFRPISLIHAIVKLISKVMAARLAPHMNKVVSKA